MKYITYILGLLAAGLAAFGYREKSKRLTQERNAEKAKSESLNRGSKAALNRVKEQDKAVEEAKSKHFTPDDIDELLRGD